MSLSDVSTRAAAGPCRPATGMVALFVRLRKAQVQYPQILSAFDAVAEQVRRDGRRLTGSPREVYFADIGSAAPSDLVCNVALPHD